MKHFRIGIDYGGVIHYAPDSWAKTIKKLIEIGHEVFLVSHCLGDGKDHLTREDFCKKSGAVNLTFYDLKPNQENEIREKKAKIVNDYNINIFIDDSPERCWAVRQKNMDCGIIHFKEWQWHHCQFVLDALSNYNPD